MSGSKALSWRRIAVPLCICLALVLAAFGYVAVGHYRSRPSSSTPWTEFQKTGSIVVRGSTFYLNPADKVITTEMVLTGAWEPTETEVFLKEAKAGGTIVDVGANIGYYTVLGARAVGPTGHVYAFEPDPTSFRFLVKNAKANGFTNVTAEQKALSNKAEKIRLYLDDFNLGDHRIYQTGNRPSVEVDAVRLDDYFGPARRKVDLIKIDTQGAEVVILLGMAETLNHNPGVKLLVEFWPKGLSEFGYSGRQLLDILKDHHFRRLQSIREETGAVIETSESELLRDFTVENGKFTNLFCSR